MSLGFEIDQFDFVGAIFLGAIVIRADRDPRAELVHRAIRSP
jgi:hypothetical protein